MISPETRKTLEDLGKTPYGKALQEFLLEELKNIDTVKGVKTLDEIIGRQIALEVVNKLFSIMGNNNPQSAGKKPSYT